MTNEQGLSLPETMVTKEQALAALGDLYDVSEDTNEAFEYFKTLEKFIEQQTKGLNQ